MNKLKASFSPKEKGLFCALKIPGKFILAFDFRCQNRILSSLATLFPLPAHGEGWHGQTRLSVSGLPSPHSGRGPG